MHYENSLVNYMEDKCHEQTLNDLIGANLSISVFSNFICFCKD